MEKSAAAPHAEYRVILNANYSGLGVPPNAPIAGRNLAGDVEASAAAPIVKLGMPTGTLNRTRQP